MRRLKATAQTVHFGFLDGSLAPVFEVESGEEFWINTVSADPEHDVPREWIPKAIPEIFERAPRGTGPHILTYRPDCREGRTARGRATDRYP
jgi:hypothetical protein